MSFFNSSELITDMLKALLQELSERSLSLTESVSRSVIKLLQSTNLLKPVNELLNRW